MREFGQTPSDRYHRDVITKRSCPWCRSDIPRDALTRCQVCDRPLTDEEGNTLREIDLTYDSVVAIEHTRRKTFLVRGTPVAALISLGAPMIHGALAFVFSLPLFMLAHGIALRIYLVREPRRLLGKRRRFFTRHIARGTFVLLTAIGYSLTTIPVTGAIAGALTFAGVTWLTQEHLMWSLRQEHDRQPPVLWEKLVLAGIVLTFVGIVVAAGTFGFVVWKLFGD